MSEDRFRLVFGLLWLMHFGVRIYFQRRVPRGLTYVRVNERQEKVLFRMFAAAYLVLPVYAATSWADVAHIPLPDLWRWLGVVVWCVGVGLFGWAHQALGRNWTAVLALSQPTNW